MKTKPKKGVRGTPLFLTKGQLCYHLGEIDPATLDEWIAAGTVPPPHSRPGERTCLWRRDHFDAFLDTGRWPEAAWPREGG